MQKHLLLFVICLFSSACSELDSTKPFDQQQAAYLLNRGGVSHPTRQMIKIALPNKNAWQRVDMSYGTVGTPIMLIPTTETRDHWQESVRTYIRPFALDEHATAEKWVQLDIDAEKRLCHRVSTDHIDSQGKTALYQLSLFQCGDNQQSFVQIGKAFTGTDAVYVVYYTAEMGRFDDKHIHRMSQMIAKAQLVQNPTTLY